MPGFVKALSDASTAAEAIRRAAALRAQGVSTPAAGKGREPHQVVFDRIDGRTGPGLVGHDFSGFLAPLHRIHVAHVDGLAPYDPFLRIRPRLKLATCGAMRAVLEESVPKGVATVHGDFHVGQLIREPSGKVWIVDLDDLAIGPPEADLANFAAHLSTSGIVGNFMQALERRRSQVLEACRAAGVECRPAVFERYLRFALVRRHLKLREAGRPDYEAGIANYLTAATTRTSPSDSEAYPG